MDEMVFTMSRTFSEDINQMRGAITIDGVTTCHTILKKSTTDARAALLIMMADALGFEPADVLDFDNLEINDNWAKEEE